MAHATKRNGRQAQPCTMVIFGAAGDLTRRLLIPALYNLARDKRLPKEFRLGGLDSTAWDGIVAGMSYIQGNFDDDDAYQRLAAHLSELQPDGAKPEGSAVAVN